MNITEDYRNLARRTLSCVIRHEKNIQILEKYIFNIATKDQVSTDTYLWYVYQVVGLVLEDPTRLKDIATKTKQGKIGWSSPTYDLVSSRLDEFDEYLVKPFDVVEGVTECGKCGSKKTWNVQKQTRGSDEPMTTFSKCVMCGHTWSYSG